MYINEMLANDVLLVLKILLGYEEALWPKNLIFSLPGESSLNPVVQPVRVVP